MFGNSTKNNSSTEQRKGTYSLIEKSWYYMAK